MDTKKNYSNGVHPDAVTNGTVADEPKLCANGESSLQPAACGEAKSGDVDINNDEDADDEYCIYTYKGDSRGAADLPSSFFNFDQGDSLSSADEGAAPPVLPLNLRLGYNGIDAFSCSSTSTTHHHVSNGSVVTVSGSRVNGVGRPPTDLFSPDMDFLEMDFDPGGLGDDEDQILGANGKYKTFNVK